MVNVSLEISETEGAKVVKKPRIKTRYAVLIALIVLLCLCLGLAHVMGAFSKNTTKVFNPPAVLKPLPPSPSRLHVFEKAAVCADAAACARIGKDILEKNGSAVDAAIATLFCNGIVNMQSMGLGGGFLMTIYIREEKRAYTLNAREFAPLTTKEELYTNDSTTKKGPLAIGVPGELKGYWAAYKRFGKLPWKELIQPSIDLCEHGYNISLAQHDSVQWDEKNIKKDPHLKTWFKDPKGENKPIGSRVIPEKLCETLKIIAKNGGDELYTGNLSKSFVDDIQEMGGLVTHDDLRNYTAEWMDPITTEFPNGEKLHTIGLPGGGPLLCFILNILAGYNMTKESIEDTNSTVLTYHRVVEAFKYAYARRTELGDPKFNELTQVIKNLTSKSYADEIRSMISDQGTSQDPKDYGAVMVNKDDHGTAHMSILAENGDAVSVTSTINLYFGAGVTSKQTGIVLNSVMDDFSYPHFNNYFGVPWSPTNVVAPGKRPLSSMSPTIITDKNGDVILVIGASGGTKITTAVAEVIMRLLWFGQNIKEAVDAPRFHHQLFPMKISYEYGHLQPILDGLNNLGHKLEIYKERGSIVCAMFRNKGKIFANSDFRKGGDVYGYN
ncbi:glutathione hydrolase 1 proenzyme-like isoform X2 [Onthophagus taurus]|uniref:glutathione hydrolase 1 proenzyme-like isoform X2 n=1 Tax=Onthophagus taurus TaxID=166361 RepID=UPI000C2056CB|nr:glutathione hydrolase 1 proenzyme-like isoform X2 [Onthophagus taurus]